MKSLVVKTVCAVGFLASTISMQASIISGTLNFAGDVRVSTTSIDFLAPVGPPDGQFTVTTNQTQTGSFAGMSETTGRVLDLNNPPNGVGVPLNVPGFLNSFSGFPGLNFTLLQIAPGTFASTPFSFNQTLTGTNVVFGVTGSVSDGTASPASSFVGQFSSNFTGQSIAQVITAIQTNGFVQDSFAATFIATAPSSGVPEPGTTMLLISGSLLLVAGGMFRRKLKQ